jgi:hypothetical protein
MNIPISLMFFTSTKGHYGHKGMYLDTLNHLDRQIPLTSFSVKVAHIKVSPDETGVASVMEKNLVDRGFKTILTVGSWERGTSHQWAYLEDQRRMSTEWSLYKNPHVLLLEDDSPFVCHKDSLEACLYHMSLRIDASPDTLTFRFIRRADYDGGVPHLRDEANCFWSPYTDFQPMMLRSRDYYLLHKAIEDNWDKVKHLQSEMLWRVMLAGFSRTEYKHLVWLPDYAESYHLGVPDYLNVRKTLNL